MYIGTYSIESSRINMLWTSNSAAASQRRISGKASVQHQARNSFAFLTSGAEPRSSRARDEYGVLYSVLYLRTV